MVIIGIPSLNEGGLNEFISSRFGRAPCFTFVTIEKDEIQEIKIVSNFAQMASGSASVKVTQLIKENNASEVIGVFIGPNTFYMLQASGIKLFLAPSREMTVKELVKLRLQDKLETITASNVDANFGNLSPQ